MTRERDPFRIPRAGFEAAPMAGLASLDLNGSGGFGSGSEFVVESAAGGVLVYAAYQALLTALRTEAMRRRGELSRSEQIRLLTVTVWESVKHGAAVSIVLGVVLLVCPWLALPFSLAGLVGMGKASLDLFHAFWDGLSEMQKAELMAQAHQAGVDLGRLVRGSDVQTA